MFVAAIERLVTLHFRIPLHTDGEDVRIGVTLNRREIHLQALFWVLLVLKAPAGDGLQRREREEAVGVFQVFVATKNFGPLTAVLFGDDRAGDNDAGDGVLRRLGNDVGDQSLL